MEQWNDAELCRLMRAAIAGDEKAYGEFLGRAACIVRNFARTRIVWGGIDPEDIVQETLLAIHLKRHTWRQDSAIMPWLQAIAKYKLVDAFRRRGRSAEVNLDEIDEPSAAPLSETASAREIKRALSLLAPGQRSIVTAISVDGRSIGETAKWLGMSETAVRVSLHRGLAAISARFGRPSHGHQ